LGRGVVEALTAQDVVALALRRKPAVSGYGSLDAKEKEEIVKGAAYFMILEVLMLSPCRAQMKTTEASPPARLEKMPEALEMRFALSALPPHLRDGATTFVLDPQEGYVVYRKGTNGFGCIVMRTEWTWPQLAFRGDIFVPICYDEEGSKKVLPVWMDVAKLRAQGLGPRQVYEQTMKKFDDGTYQKPSRTGISYMTAPVMRTYPSPDATEVVTMSMRHYMFYAPNVKDADIGGKPSSPYPFVVSQGPGPHDVIVLLIGEAEKAKIVADSADLLKDLCSYRKDLCLNTASHEHH
jgi:hypothetical protein